MHAVLLVDNVKQAAPVFEYKMIRWDFKQHQDLDYDFLVENKQYSF